MKWHGRKGVEHTQDYESQQQFSSFSRSSTFLRLRKQASTSNELIFSSTSRKPAMACRKKTNMIFHGCRKKWSFLSSPNLSRFIFWAICIMNTIQLLKLYSRKIEMWWDFIFQLTKGRQRNYFNNFLLPYHFTRLF